MFNKSSGNKLTILLSIIIVTSIINISCSSKNSEEPSIAPSTDTPTTPATPAAIEPEPKVKDREIDFESLCKRNEEVVAWLEIPGSDIDYPVLYSEDNDYYLKHNLDKKYDVAGAIFLDMNNFGEIDNPMTVIYGHFMPDDTQFTQLHRYRDKSYFIENRIIKIFTPEHQFNYEIVAALEIDDRYTFYNPYTKTHSLYDNPEDMQYFIDWITDENNSNSLLLKDGMNIDDRFLVLSTCTKVGETDKRYFVVGRQTEII